MHYRPHALDLLYQSTSRRSPRSNNMDTLDETELSISELAGSKIGIESPEKDLLLAVMENGIRTVFNYTTYANMNRKSWSKKRFTDLEDIYYAFKWLLSEDTNDIYAFESICSFFNDLNANSIRKMVFKKMEIEPFEISYIMCKLEDWLKRTMRVMPGRSCVRVVQKKRETPGRGQLRLL